MKESLILVLLLLSKWLIWISFYWFLLTTSFKSMTKTFFGRNLDASRKKSKYQYGGRERSSHGVKEAAMRWNCINSQAVVRRWSLKYAFLKFHKRNKQASVLEYLFWQSLCFQAKTLSNRHLCERSRIGAIFWLLSWSTCNWFFKVIIKGYVFSEVSKNVMG